MKQDDRVPEPSEDLDDLEDLYNDAMLAQGAKNPKQKRVSDPAFRNALDAEAKRMRELYTLPENWERKRGVALIDADTQTLIGNFSEYLHKTIPGTRKLIREHQLISIDGQEVVRGYLGDEMQMRLHGTWHDTRHGTADLWFDELMVGAPTVRFEARLRLGVFIRLDLMEATQFASASGAVLLQLPAGTNVLEALSHDSKAAVRKAVGL